MLIISSHYWPWSSIRLFVSTKYLDYLLPLSILNFTEAYFSSADLIWLLFSYFFRLLILFYFSVFSDFPTSFYYLRLSIPFYVCAIFINFWQHIYSSPAFYYFISFSWLPAQVLCSPTALFSGNNSSSRCFLLNLKFLCCFPPFSVSNWDDTPDFQFYFQKSFSEEILAVLIRYLKKKTKFMRNMESSIEKINKGKIFVFDKVYQAH